MTGDRLAEIEAHGDAWLKTLDFGAREMSKKAIIRAFREREVETAWLIARVRELERVAAKAINLYEGAVRGMIYLIPSDRIARDHEDALEAELDTMRAALEKGEE